MGNMRSVKLFLTTALVCVLLTFGSVALAQSGGEVNDADVDAETVVPQSRDTNTGTLPFTGADVTLFVVIGLGAIGAGSVLVRRTRKASSSS